MLTSSINGDKATEDSVRGVSCVEGKSGNCAKYVRGGCRIL